MRRDDTAKVEETGLSVGKTTTPPSKRSGMLKIHGFVPSLLAGAYVLFCLLVGLIVPDSANLSWATDFFIATIFGLMTLRLLLRTSLWRMTSFSFLLQSLAYFTKGMSSKSYGDILNAEVHGRGGIPTGIFLLTWLYYLLWTGSALLYAFLINHALEKAKQGGAGLTCGLLESRVLFGMIGVAALFVSTGCLWCMMTLWNSQASEEEDNRGHALPITFLLYGQLFWHGFYSALIITAVYVWSALANQMEVFVGGLSRSVATAVVVVSQVSILAIVIFYALDIANNSGSERRSKQPYMYTTVFFNFATLVTGYFVHSFLLSLFPGAVDDGKSAGSTDDDSFDEENPPMSSSSFSSKEDRDDEDASSFGNRSDMDLVDESCSDDDTELDKYKIQAVAGEKSLPRKSGNRFGYYAPEELPSGMTSGRVLTYFVGMTAEES